MQNHEISTMVLEWFRWFYYVLVGLNLSAMCLDYFFGLSRAGNPPFQHNVDPEIDDCSLAIKKNT